MARMSTSAPSSLDRIGVGIDTARYGHRVSFLRPDRQPAAKPITVMETQAGYQSLREQLERLQGQHPQANFHVRIDAAGQYAVNLERFLRGLALPLTISIGEPKRNKDYQKAHFPKRTTDDTESQAMARFAVTQVCHCQQAEQKMRDLLATAFADLPASGHRQRITIPGIGAATAAVLAAKIIDIDRFETADHLVGYFGIFPQESSSGVDKDGKPLPPGTMCMSPKGNDLVRSYLWNAARVGIRFNPALRALYARLKAKGRRGDVAIGHCMRKLLHLVFAVWKTNRPFDKTYFPWEPSDSQVSPTAPVAAETSGSPASVATSQPVAAAPAAEPANEKAAGHKQEVPAEKVVATATSSVALVLPAVNPAATPTATAARPRVDFAFLRGQITMEQVLRHLGQFDRLRGRGQQRRCVCPLHAQPDDREPTLSIHLGKNLFHCFHAKCAAKGNVLDLWAAMHHLPLYEAALHLAETFHLLPNREEAPV